eukprot:snap_masked-scaffold_28-processed-gene-2.10-mRNA-1 protein AED:1.00 eAED:1.00 QI:0/0/0/0/1/1/2/0/310
MNIIMKSGTTVLSWIITSVVNHLKEIDNSYKIENEERYNTLWTKNKVMFFSTNTKHEGRVYSGEYNHKYHIKNYDFNLIVPNIAKEILLKGYSLGKESKTKNKVIEIIQNNIHIAKQHFHEKIESKEKKFRKKHFTIIRDPIAVLVSYQHYFNKYITSQKLNQVVKEECEYKTIQTALTYELVSKILPNMGYEFEILYYRELRKEPYIFMQKFFKNIGLDLGIEEENIINKVMEDTSMEKMEEIQKEVLNGKKTTLTGLSREGNNSRKVRKAEINGYLKELRPKVVEECYGYMRIHLQQDLLEKFEIPIK